MTDHAAPTSELDPITVSFHWSDNGETLISVVDDMSGEPVLWFLDIGPHRELPELLAAYHHPRRRDADLKGDP